MTVVQATDARGPDAAGEEHSDWWRAARLWAVVACFVAVGVARSVQVGIPFRDPGGAFLVTRVALTLAIFVGLVAVDGLLRTGRPRTVSRVWTTVRTRWTPRRLALAWTALLAYHATYFTYHNLKSWDVLNAPRDTLLTAWDQWLFLGHSPAVLLHDLLGQHDAAWVLMVWYETLPDARRGRLPGGRRAPHADARRVRRDRGLRVDVDPRDGDLLRDPEPRALPRRAGGLRRAAAHADPGHAGAIHGAARPPPRAPAGRGRVRAGVRVRQPARGHRPRRSSGSRGGTGCVVRRLVLAVFLAGTMVATVYLGWHFAVDLPAGLAIAALGWVLGPLTVGVRHRPPPRRAPGGGRERP